MKVGKPKRVHRVEPLREPVPDEPAGPTQRPESKPDEPKKVPAK
jgi:hypothetical protein